MAGKFYAVKKGSTTGIFTSWEACKASVYGYSGAIYKSFKTKEEADAYLGLGSAEEALQKEAAADVMASQKINGVRIYVDGSYHTGTGEFSYGMVVLTDNGEETYNRKFQDKELASMRNVAGEIMGAMAAMQYAQDRNIPEIVIYHDYEGIARWCMGEWKANKEGTKAYKAFYDQISQHIKVHFVKVAGHSNDKYNDMADELAKEALGI